jgi:hypothetical protein
MLDRSQRERTGNGDSQALVGQLAGGSFPETSLQVLRGSWSAASAEHEMGLSERQPLSKGITIWPLLTVNVWGPGLSVLPVSQVKLKFNIFLPGAGGGSGGVCGEGGGLEFELRASCLLDRLSTT